MKRIAFLAVAALVLAAGPALASNTGFKLNHDMWQGQNATSLPYFYFPDGDVNNTTQDAQGLCCDLDADGMIGAVNCVTAGYVAGGGDCDMISIIELRPAGAFTKPCLSSALNFDLVPGKGYLVTPAAACTGNIVGSHDDNYSRGKGSTMLDLVTGQNLTSIPYHVVAVDKNELCTDLNAEYGGTVVSMIELRQTGAFTAPCAAPPLNFDLMAGRAYFLVMTADTSIQFETY